MRETEMIGKAYRHMGLTYTYSHTSEGIRYWWSESVNGAYYVRQTQA